MPNLAVDDTACNWELDHWGPFQSKSFYHSTVLSFYDSFVAIRSREHVWCQISLDMVTTYEGTSELWDILGVKVQKVYGQSKKKEAPRAEGDTGCSWGCSASRAGAEGWADLWCSSRPGECCAWKIVITESPSHWIIKVGKDHQVKSHQVQSSKSSFCLSPIPKSFWQSHLHDEYI